MQDFYEDVFEELDKYGEIENLNVCDNLADHLVGNVYVKFKEEESAAAALAGLAGRPYAGEAGCDTSRRTSPSLSTPPPQLAALVAACAAHFSPFTHGPLPQLPRIRGARVLTTVITLPVRLQAARSLRSSLP